MATAEAAFRLFVAAGPLAETAVETRVTVVRVTNSVIGLNKRRMTQAPLSRVLIVVLLSSGSIDRSAPNADGERRSVEKKQNCGKMKGDLRDARTLDHLSRHEGILSITASTFAPISRREFFHAPRGDAGILPRMGDLTAMLLAIKPGDRIAAEKLLPLVYDELRKLAAQRMAREGPGHTLNPTALVHEAYLRLVKVPSSEQWDGRAHFFAAAAQAMRRILVDNARRKRLLKQGGKKVPVEEVSEPDNDSRVLLLDDALKRLAQEDRQAARVVEMHHFAGMSHEMVADALGLTVYRVRQKWTYAQAWLRHDLKR
jgi:RNA polymerase sigma factor (TIGR02999 family)